MRFPLVGHKNLRLTREASTRSGRDNVLMMNAFVACETQDFALLSQQFFNIASKGLFSWVVLTDCYISNKYGQSVQSFFCAPITEL